MYKYPLPVVSVGNIVEAFICGVVCFLSPVECDSVCHHKIVETERPTLLTHLPGDAAAPIEHLFFFRHRMGKRLREEFGNNVAFGLEGGYNLQASERKDIFAGRKKMVENSPKILWKCKISANKNVVQFSRTNWNKRANERFCVPLCRFTHSAFSLALIPHVLANYHVFYGYRRMRDRPNGVNEPFQPSHNAWTRILLDSTHFVLQLYRRHHFYMLVLAPSLP